MNDELRAAAERLRRLDSAQNMTTEDWEATYGAGGGFKYDVEDDKWTLTRAYLADHPADDAEPVTEEWLRGLGFVDDHVDASALAMHVTGWPAGERWMVVILLAGWEAVVERTDGEWEGSNVELCPQPTRGHVRRLLRALGITPQEKP